MKSDTPKEAQLGLLQQRYAGRGKTGKTRLLDEYCDHYGHESKHAIKLLGGYIKEAIIAFNHACYECQLNRMDEALRWLARAFENGNPAAIRDLAIKDEDLKPLWPRFNIGSAA